MSEQSLFQLPSNDENESSSEAQRDFKKESQLPLADCQRQ